MHLDITDPNNQTISDITEVARYAYNEDGSMKYKEDLKSGDITHFVTTKYNYSSAGIIFSAVLYNNGVQTSIYVI
ncbi:MAG: hypothetical protein LBS81_01040 [Endomicrobium sp.]|jgi:hypothetical protein|nr:hypothetical protein [Endomicrobium sp.]